MDRHSELAAIRHAYAKQLLATAGVSDRRLEQAYASVPREDFLSPGPWEIGTEEGTYFRVIHGDGTTTPFQKADVIYVCAGATRPVDLWLDKLAEGGRLIIPLTVDEKYLAQFDAIDPGAVFQIGRHGDDYLARWISVVAIFPCAGARDETSGRALAEALHNGREKEVTRLYRSSAPPEEHCWLRAPGWSLAYC